MTDVALPSGIAQDELDESGASAGRPVPPRQRQVDRAHRDPRRQGALRLVLRAARGGRGGRARDHRGVAAGRAGHRGAQGRRPLRELPRREARRDARLDAHRRRARRGRRSWTRSSRSSTTLGRLERQGVSGFFQLFVDNDPGDPERYLVFVEQGGIGLPDESYFREEKFAPIREAYRAHLERMFAARAARRRRPSAPSGSFDLETAIAARALEQRRHARQREDLQPDELGGGRGAAASDRHLQVWRDAMGVPAGAFDEVVVREPSFVEGLGAPAHRRAPAGLEGLARAGRSSARARAVPARATSSTRTSTSTARRSPAPRSCASAGSAASRSSRAPWARRSAASTSSGTSRPTREDGDGRPRREPRRGVPRVIIAPRVDERRHPRAGAREARRSSRRRSASRSSGATTRRSRSTPTTCVGNVRATSEFEFDRELGKIGKPIDRDEWFMTPQTINAYYNPGFNEIVFPAAILQYPFFDEERDAAANYGAIGAVIGHEIGHGFDDQGSKYDGDGRLTDWWTEADRDRVRGAHQGAHRPVRRARAGAAARPPRQRRAHHRREHRRPRRARRSRGRRTCSRSAARAAGDRRPHRRAALLPVAGRRPGR